ncbi:MAG TPA: discoidin domain-containing protein [Thermoanaerobaculia bacterium]|nr:discoidin domain-containing protein [Thermoanaerobaculia bacterium]
MRRIAAILLLLFALACGRPAEPESSDQTPKIDHDRGNLLLVPRGASVLTRSGENTLLTSAAHALDGDSDTVWQTPSGGASQSMILSLAAPARITRLGVLTTKHASESPQQVRFAASSDAASWRDVATIDVKDGAELHTIDVTPFEARYLRADLAEPREEFSVVRSLLAFGTELAPPAPPLLEGCWSINGKPARFVQRGSSVAGLIGDPPMFVSGGTDGRAFRVMWRKGPMWGAAIVGVDAQRRAMSGLVWHEDVIGRGGNGNAWFGAPAPCRDARIDETEIAAAVMQRAGHWMMYGDSAIDTAAALIRREPSRRFRIVARDAARMNGVRAALQTRGIDVARIGFEVASATSPTESQRALADGVALYTR